MIKQEYASGCMPAKIIKKRKKEPRSGNPSSVKVGLQDDTIRAIRKEFKMAPFPSCRELGKKYGVSYSVISNITTGKAYKHVK